MPALLSNPVEHLLALAAAAAGGRAAIVGLVGMPGAGKSTLAAQWVREVNAAAGAGTALALGMDGFHLRRAQLAQMPDPAAALARRGAPWTFDAQALARRLRELREATGPVYWPGFDHGVGDPAPNAIAIAPGTRLLLVEGLHLLHQGDGWALDGLLDECVYLDVPLPVAMQRLSARHQAAWGFTPAQAQARIEANDGLNAVLVEQTRERADWVVADQTFTVK
jgi:pantothenate kinase